MSDEALQIGARIGPYRILSELGQGGMAEVYLAEQSEPVRRQVALKVLKAGMDTRQIVGRFEAERQALAVLDHPHIAKVFDGGTTPAGRPFFVMERVRGVPVTDYCDTHRLTVHERIGLMRTVCGAVQHAHQKGIIHRDLKPSNILVALHDGEPWPMVIDFGIAKAVHAGAGEADHTRIGQLIGTPQYMSPEQAEMSGLDIDTRTDVYSLGCVLYELLLGVPPRDLRAVPQHAVGYALRETETTRPSARLDTLSTEGATLARYRRTDVRALRGMLKGDLDWVVMKALAPDRTLRYSTADALAADLGRFLAGEPVEAHPPNAVYLLSRAVRRHRGAVLAASVVFVSLLLGAGAATFGLLEARKAGAQARAEAETSRQVTALLASVFEVSDPERRGGQATAREILDEGLERIDDELADRPAVLAEVLTAIGKAYKNLAEFDAAERALRRAVELQVGLGRTETLAYADAVRALAAVHIRRKRVVDAEEMLNEALRLYESTIGRLSLPYAETLSDLANVYGEQPLRDYKRAVDLRREAVEILRQLDGVDVELEMVRSALAFSLARAGEREEAESLYLSSLARLEELLPAEDLTLSTIRNNYALLLYTTGRVREAAQVFREVIEWRRVAYDGEPHTHTATTARSLGTALLALGEYAEAVTVLRASLAEMREIYRGELTPDIAAGLRALGQAYLLSGEARPAIEALTEAHEIMLQTQGETTSSAALELLLAEAYLLAGDYAQAKTTARRARVGYQEHDKAGTGEFWVMSADAVEFWARERLGEDVDAAARLLAPYRRFVERGRSSGAYYRITVQRLKLYHESRGEFEAAAQYHALLAPVPSDRP